MCIIFCFTNENMKNFIRFAMLITMELSSFIFNFLFIIICLFFLFLSYSILFLRPFHVVIIAAKFYFILHTLKKSPFILTAAETIFDAYCTFFFYIFKKGLILLQEILLINKI